MPNILQAAQEFMYESKSDATAVQRDITPKTVLIRCATGFRFTAQFSQGGLVGTEAKAVGQSNTLAHFLQSLAVDLNELEEPDDNMQVHIAKSKEGWLAYISIQDKSPLTGRTSNDSQ